MLRFDVLTLFPALFGPFLAEGVLGKAIQRGLLAVEPVSFREHGLGRHRLVDDVPYGGGPGMVLRPEPIFAAVREREALHAREGRRLWKILVSPQGEPFRQAKAEALAQRKEALLLICGRYEGFDERIRLGLADEELSGGDYVALGGEAVAMIVIEAVARLVPGVLGNAESRSEESFAGGLLEYPHYTRPPTFEGMAVPEVLLSGDHGRIARWRQEQAQARTARRRPDLLRPEPPPREPLAPDGSARHPPTGQGRRAAADDPEAE
ncbi:MAG: tRNA (guanosine(37)-N1)-methyltransferase TrmD [Candidatus Lambdaproteobacteria bacterium]|nr:tRNA (guanosine(37)-N1)-methyltransferase TrmD [Candidatus Lambdaproteobacteria bacterium]